MERPIRLVTRDLHSKTGILVNDPDDGCDVFVIELPTCKVQGLV